MSFLKGNKNNRILTGKNGKYLINNSTSLTFLDIPVDLFIHFENGNIGDPISKTTFQNLMSGRYYSLSLTEDDSRTDFTDFLLVSSNNPFRYKINVDNVSIDGTGTRGLHLVNSTAREQWNINLPRCKKIAVAGFAIWNTDPTIEENIDWLVVNTDTSGFASFQNRVASGEYKILAHGDNGTGGGVGGTINITRNKKYWFVLYVDVGISFARWRVYDPVDWSLVGSVDYVTTGNWINLISMETGYLFGVEDITCDNIIIAYDDNAVDDLGVTQPTDLSGRDVYANIIGRYRMGEGTGILADNDSLSGAALSFVNTTWTTGDNGKAAVAFDGADAYLQGGGQYKFTTLGWSVSARIHIAAFNSGNSSIICGFGDFNNAGWYFGLFDGGYLQLVISQSGVEQDITSPIGTVAVGTHDVVGVTHADGSGELYLDGVVVKTVPAGTLNPPTASANNFLVGAYSHFGGFFNGWMQEIRFYNSALTAAEALRIHNNAP